MTPGLAALPTNLFTLPAAGKIFVYHQYCIDNAFLLSTAFLAQQLAPQAIQPEMVLRNLAEIGKQIQKIQTNQQNIAQPGTLAGMLAYK